MKSRQTTLTFGIYSEVAPLQTVLLHRPGSELESLTPQYLDAMLFEDIPYLAKMAEEHDKFARTLEAAGCTVIYFTDLLQQALTDTELRQRLISDTVDRAEVKHPRIREDLKGFLLQQDISMLSELLIGGVLKSRVPLSRSAPDLSYYIRDEYPYYISPLPNLYFTRDPGTAIGTGFSVNTMRTEARRRETLLLSAVLSSLQTNLKDPGNRPGLLQDYTDGASIEGGDILVLSPNALAVGCSARTDAWAIEKLAERVLEPLDSGNGFEQLLVVQIPFIRAYMHLDTVFTMVDHDKFTIYPGVERRLKVFKITKLVDGSLQVHQQQDIRSALKEVLAVPAVDLIQTGGGDSITAAREQWNDSTNTLAIAPGRVVTYQRNVVSNETLTRHGIEVLTIEGSELVRGRGGPRCMSMPIRREKR